MVVLLGVVSAQQIVGQLRLMRLMMLFAPKPSWFRPTSRCWISVGALSKG